MAKPSLFYSFVLLLTFFMVSCGKKVPPEYQALEGEWRHPEVYMEISGDGTFAYKRKSDGQTVTINTWIIEYSDKGFTVSTVFGKTDFVLNRKPFYNDSLKTTQMIVDGRILTKQ